MTTQYINTGKLQDIINGIPSHRFVTITTETPVKMNKRNNPYHDNVTKRSTANVSVNFSYENAVNNRLEKEGKEATFVAAERKWGQKVDNKLVSKTETNGDTKNYIALGYKSKPSSVEYFLSDTGEAIDKTLFAEFIPERKSNAGHQGLSEENEVIYRNVKLGNIKELKYNGIHYIVKNS